MYSWQIERKDWVVGWVPGSFPFEDVLNMPLGYDYEDPECVEAAHLLIRQKLGQQDYFREFPDRSICVNVRWWGEPGVGCYEVEGELLKEIRSIPDGYCKHEGPFDPPDAEL